MTFPEIAVLALIAITFLYLMIVVVRGRMRTAALRQTRRDVLRGAVDPARSAAPPDHADVEHDAPG